jgi:hypothetical protein
MTESDALFHPRGFPMPVMTKTAIPQEIIPTSDPIVNPTTSVHTEEREQRGDYICLLILLACMLLIFSLNVVHLIIGLFS